MKDAYLPHHTKNTDDELSAPRSQPVNTRREDEGSGPDAMVYLTKISARTPDEEITRILAEDPDRELTRRTYDFYTVVLASSMQISDPSTTRFINAIVSVDFPSEIQIRNYSPKEKDLIMGIIETGADGISVSPALDFSGPALKRIPVHPDNPEKRFKITVGPGMNMSGTYSKTTGYTLDIPACELLEYEGMLKNGHEVYWEIYPPMPPQDIESPGNEKLAVFSVIIQVPRNAYTAMNVRIDGKVKGDLWGVVHLNGSVVLSKT